MPNDQFGIKLIYPTKASGVTWFFDSSKVNNDSRFSGATLSGNQNDGWTPGSGNSRIKTLTPAGYDENALPANHDHLMCQTRGYFYSSGDWADTEQTEHVRWLSASSTTGHTMYCRGGRHTSSHFCPGFAYKLDSREDGSFRFGKEQYHTQYTWHAWKNIFPEGFITHGWFGQKMIAYNTDIGNGRIGVKLELWIDKDLTNDWEKVLEDLDQGGWGDSDDCGSETPKDIIGTWKGPEVVYRFDDLGDIRIKNMSVREIEAGGTFTDPIPSATINATPRVTASLRMHYRIGTTSAPTCTAEIPEDPNPPPPPPPVGNVNVVKKTAFTYDILQ